jgi:hypothetical protein
LGGGRAELLALSPRLLLLLFLIVLLMVFL